MSIEQILRETQAIRAMENFGKQIPGSRYYRSYCRRCKTPMRVFQSGDIILCELCNPPHKGCSSPSSRQDTEDYDSYGGGSVSTQHSYGGLES